MDTKGFTLLELLVVVLIIGILAAIALPQYRVAVKKAKLMKYVPVVRTLYQTELAYKLANGSFTADISTLDVDIPAQGCTYTPPDSSSTPSAYYTCGDERYGVWHLTNAQAGDNTIRYVQCFDDHQTYSEIKAGDIACFSKGEVARKACRTLGPGTEIAGASGWNYVWKLDR